VSSVVLFAVLARVLLVAGPAAAVRAPESHEAALRAVQASDWPVAFAEARRTLEADPDFAPAYRVLVDAAFAAGRPSDALELLETLGTQAPPRALPHASLATLQRRLGDFAAAARHADKALEADRGSLAALFELALAARAQGRLEALAERLGRAAAAEPASAELAYAAAHVLELAFRFEEAERWLARSERVRRLPEHSLSRARMLLEHGRRPECVAVAEAGLALAEGGPDSEPVRVQILVAKSRCEYELGRRPGARLSSEAALELARRSGDVSGEGDAWRALGYATEYPERGAAFERATALHESVREEAKLAEDLVARGIHGYPANIEVTRALSLRSLQLAAKAGDLRTEIRARGTYGGNLVVRGELWAAIPHLLKNYEAARRIGSARAEAVNAANLAEALLNAGDLQLAEEYTLRSRAAYRRSEDAGGEALSLAGLGDLAYERRDYARALELHRRGSEMWAATGRANAALLIKVALDHQARGELRAARERCREAIAAAALVSDSVAGARAELLLAEMDLSDGRQEQAIQKLEHVLEAIVGEGYEPQLAVQAHRALARAFRSQGRTQQAHAHYRSALAWIEQLRAGIPLSSLRTLFFRERQGVYVEAVELLYDMHRRDPAAGHDREAFSVTEHARARVLLEAVGAGEPISPRAERSESQARLSRIEGALRDSGTPAAERERLTRLRALEERRLANLELLELEQEPAEPLSLRPPELSQVQQALPERTLLLEFLLGKERSFVFAVSRDRVRFLALPPRREIEGRVRAFRALAGVHPAGPLDAQLARIGSLGATLLAELAGAASADLDASRELVIAPDGILFYLPFEALRRAEGAPLLAETHTLRYTPSAALLAQPRAGPAPERRGATLVAFGDPRLEAAAADEPSLLRSLERGGFRLAPLPASGDEVRAIAGLFGPDEAKLYLGDAFREQAVVDELSRGHRYVHFATHAVVDEQAPLRSGIVVSRAPGADEDGVLQVREIASLRISADLVTLSACQTGLGALVDGEGMLGLARAFQQAGARRLVVSLWNVNDFSTGKFMAAFYRFLQAGDSPALALASARREMLRSPNPSLRHPYHWAGFVLIGG
jgi:tetratricopeptide (TPR) repeat protein